MSAMNSTAINNVLHYYPDRPIQFSILLLISISSIPCFIFVLYYFLTTRALYSALNNHVIIILLVSNSVQTLVDVPMRLSTYFTGIMWPPNVYFCYFYYFVDFYLFTSCFLLLTWASFERHILIFHRQLYNTSRKRLIGHYIPLSLCIVYPLIYYIIFIFFYPCESYYDVNTSKCVAACYLWASSLMALYEQIVHGFALMFLICILNIFLFLRVLWQKRLLSRQITWSKNRKMAIQLFSVFFLFVFTNGGYFTIELGQMVWDPIFGLTFIAWVFPLSMCMPPLVPFTCLSSIQNLQFKLKMLVPWFHPAVVAPSTMTGTQHIRTIVPKSRIV